MSYPLSAGFVDTIREISREANLSLGQRVKLRLLLRFRPEVLQAVVLDQARAEGLVDSGVSPMEIDWPALAEFLKEILPVILDIVSIFL